MKFNYENWELIRDSGSIVLIDHLGMGLVDFSVVGSNPDLVRADTK